MVVLRNQFKQPGDGFTRKTMSLPIPNHRSTVELNQPSHENNNNNTNSNGNIRQQRPTQRRYTTSIHKYHRCGWFSTIHIRLRLCSVVISLQRVPREPCHNDVCFASSSRGLDTPSSQGHVKKKTSTRMMWCIISKGGEDGRDRLRITITRRVRIRIYFLPCGYTKR